MKEEIEQILMNNFSRGDIKTATQQLIDEFSGGKYSEKWLAKNIEKRVLESMDLKQYVTNLLYAAYDKGVQGEAIIPFDLWIEKMISLIDEYYMLKNTRSV
jgi:hypothetical protein